MLIIIEQDFTDGCTFYSTINTPCNYESLEAAIVEFEIVNARAIQDQKDYFEFGGSRFEPSFGQRYENAPIFRTLEEWVECNRF